ncbi:MAG TPA: FGGY family carbohydrate kinase [Chryseosolibacter sp.]|nr:FGGY family carbohydrate kinase [Chryseosolibacter sp.]
MTQRDAFLIIDIGTGNVRVALTTTDGEILSIERDNVHYTSDPLYPDALHFEPDALWDQIVKLTRAAVQRVPDTRTIAVTVSSQREGIVLLDASGRSLIGLPNHDRRGREWEHEVAEKSRIYKITGRFPSWLFSAMKVIGIRKKRPEIYNKLQTIVSISDWAQFQLSGVAGYEHSQASETQLYDVEKKSWSNELCSLFNLPERILPALHSSGTILGKVLPEVARDLSISEDAVVVVGGADTQLAIKSTAPAVDDIVIVSGTTTPIAKIVPNYVYDVKERTWTNRHVDKDNFILEANAGVTGLNYQRLKEIFYPNEGYDVIEKELATSSDDVCVASLGSLVADEKQPLTKGGFFFDAPVSHQLTRAGFVRATLWDIACAIKDNYDALTDVTPHQTNYVWACGGGFQSTMLTQNIADLIQKNVRIRSGYRQASVSGGVAVCSEALKLQHHSNGSYDVVAPRNEKTTAAQYEEWRKTRSNLRKIF